MIIAGVKVCLAHTRGWMRRADLDDGSFMQVWERPDGKLFDHYCEPLLAVPTERHPE